MSGHPSIVGIKNLKIAVENLRQKLVIRDELTDAVQKLPKANEELALAQRRVLDLHR